VQTGETGLATLRRFNCVIPREVAESIRRILIHRRMDSATTLRSAQNDNLFRTAVRLRGNDDFFATASAGEGKRGNGMESVRLIADCPSID